MQASAVEGHGELKGGGGGESGEGRRRAGSLYVVAGVATKLLFPFIWAALAGCTKSWSLYLLGDPNLRTYVIPAFRLRLTFSHVSSPSCAPSPSVPS